MKWSHSLAVAAFTGLIGLFAAGFATSLGVKWYDVHAFEGAEGFVVAACAILGLIAGFVVGLGLSRLVARSERPSAPKAAAVSAAALVVTIVAITTMARILADIPPLSEGEQLFLMVEVQTPVGYPSPDTLSGIGYLKLRHKERGPLFKEDVRFVDDRWVIPGVVRVFTSRGRRSLDVVIGEVQLGAFCTALTGAPGGRESSVERVAARRFWRLAPVWGIAALGSIHRQIPSCSTKRATADRVDRSLFHRNGGQCVLFSSVVGASGCPIVFPRQLQRSGAAGFRSFRVSRCIERPADGSPRSGAPHRPYGDLSSGRRQRNRRGGPIGRRLRRPDFWPSADFGSGTLCCRPEQGSGVRLVDRVTFDRPGLFVVRDNVLDTRDLTFRRVAFPEGLSSWQPPPFGLSPDQRSLVGFLHHEAQTQNPTLAVTDWTTGHSSRCKSIASVCALSGSRLSIPCGSHIISDGGAPPKEWTCWRSGRTSSHCRIAPT